MFPGNSSLDLSLENTTLDFSGIYQGFKLKCDITSNPNPFVHGRVQKRNLMKKYWHPDLKIGWVCFNKDVPTSVLIYPVRMPSIFVNLDRKASRDAYKSIRAFGVCAFWFLV